MKSWKKSTCLALAACLALALFASVGAAGDKQAAKPEAAADMGTEIVAKVNGVDIPQSELVRMMQIIQMQYARAGRRIPPDQLPELRQKLMDRLIGDELLWQAAKKAGYKPDKKAAEEQIAQLKARYPSDVEFKRALERQKLTESDLMRELERNDVLKKFMTDKFLDKAKPGEAEMKKFYDDNPQLFTGQDQVKAAHILVAVDENASEADKKKAREKIDRAAKRVKGGEDFAKVAKEVSDCPSKEKGGDLGYFGHGQMVPEFETAAFALEPGQMSDVVETKFGYHVIKLEDKKTGDKVPYDQVKEDILRNLTNQKAEEEVGKYVEELRKNAKVEVLLKDAPAEAAPVAEPDKK